MSSFNVDSSPQKVYEAGAGPGLLVNLDDTNPFYIGPNKGLNSLSDQIPAQASVAVDGSADVYAGTLNQAITVKIQSMIGALQWDNPVGVQVALNALGLAKDSSVIATTAAVGSVDSTLGSPAQDATVAGVTTRLGAGPLALPTGAARDASVAALPGTIATTGVPLLRNPNNAGHGSGLTLAPGGVILLGGTPVAQPSFEMAIQLKMPSATGTVPLGALILTWSDSSSGLTLGFEDYVLPCGNGVFVNGFLVGPMYGDTLELELTNQDPAVTLTYNWTFTETSHVYERVRFTETNGAGINGFTRPDVFPSAGVLAASNPTIAGAGTVNRLATTWGGKARLSIDNSGGANSCLVKLLDPSGLFSVAADGFFTGLSAAAGAINSAELTLPNGPMLVSMINGGASGSIAPVVTLEREEY